MPLADRLRSLRKGRRLSLDDLAKAASISKTYLWELEKGTEGKGNPSVDVATRLADALGTTLAELLGVATATGDARFSPAMKEFAERMKLLGSPLSTDDLRALAVIVFRGRQPATADQWHQLYFALT